MLFGFTTQKDTAYKTFDFIAKVFCAGFLIVVFGILSYHQSIAAFGSPLVSANDNFNMQFLDLNLIPGSFSDASTTFGSPNMSMYPGRAVEKLINRQVASGFGTQTIAYKFDVNIVQTGGDSSFCSTLKLAVFDSVVDTGSQLYPAVGTPYSNLIGNILVATPGGGTGVTGVGGLVYKVFYPVDAAAVYNKTCKFKIKYHFYQNSVPSPGLFGLTDDEEEDGVVQSAADDPSLTVKSVTDTSVDESVPTTSFFNSAWAGTSTSLRVKSRNANRNQRAFVKFAASLPATSTVSSAKLRLYMLTAPTIDQTLHARALTSDFNETTTNWNNQPGSSTTVTATTTTGTAALTWVEFDVTSDVQSFTSGTMTNFGWSISNATESAVTSNLQANAVFSSTDNAASTAPQLILTFSTPSSNATHVVVNEVFANAKSSSPETQFVELYNPTNASVDVSTWYICDNTADSDCDRFSAGLLPLPAQGFALLVKNKNELDDLTLDYPLPKPECNTVNYPNCTLIIQLESLIGSGLSTYSDRVILRDSLFAVVDQISYGLDTSVHNPAISYASIGASMARVVKGYDNDLASDWIVNATPNPGTNPSSSGAETMIFTTRGVFVADAKAGVDPSLLALGDTVIMPEAEVEDEAYLDMGGSGCREGEIQRVYGLGEGGAAVVCEAMSFAGGVVGGEMASETVIGTQTPVGTQTSVGTSTPSETGTVEPPQPASQDQVTIPSQDDPTQQNANTSVSPTHDMPLTTNEAPPQDVHNDMPIPDIASPQTQ